jgi:hypothetical protein
MQEMDGLTDYPLRNCFLCYYIIISLLNNQRRPKFTTEKHLFKNVTPSFNTVSQENIFDYMFHIKLCLPGMQLLHKCIYRLIFEDMGSKYMVNICHVVYK